MVKVSSLNTNMCQGGQRQDSQNGRKVGLFLVASGVHKDHIYILWSVQRRTTRILEYEITAVRIYIIYIYGKKEEE